MDRIIGKKKIRPRRILSLALLAIPVLLAVYAFIPGGEGSRLRVDRDRLSISTVERGQFQEFIPVTGEIVPIRTVYLDAIEGGRVEAVYVEDGNFVEEGDKLLKLVNTNLLLDIMYREAELFQQSNNLRNTELALEQNRLEMRDQVLEIEIELKKTKRNYERSKKLIEEGLVPAQDFEEARDDYEFYVKKRDHVHDAQRQEKIYRENQVEQLRASLTRMDSNLQVAKKNLEDLVVEAPVSGYLTSLDAEVGESKVRGERLGQIDILDGFKVRLRVDEHYITRLAKGQVGLVTYRQKEHELVTDKISPEVVDGRCEVDMEFIGSQPEDLRRGQTLQVRLQLGGPSESILLKKGAFFQDTGGRWVYVVDPSGSVALRREVRLGLENPYHFQVLEGLQPGEQVITSSYSTFGDAEQLILK
jgi:HlyD family secretion protein